MYPTEEVKELLQGLKLTNGSGWINVRQGDHKKIKNFMEDKDELSLDELVDMVKITEDESIAVEDIDLDLINNKISEAEALKKKAAYQKGVIQIHVKHKKGGDLFYITKAQNLNQVDL